MRGFYLVNYKVNGIKTLDRDVDLSFYKKVIKNPVDFQNYNIKGIYGMNGTGKTSIVTSVKILKDLLLSSRYLINDINKKKINKLINFHSKRLDIEVDFLVDLKKAGRTILLNYQVELQESSKGVVTIKRELLKSKNAISYNSEFHTLIKIDNGYVTEINTDPDFKELFISKTTNLLSDSSFCSLFKDKVLPVVDEEATYYSEDDLFFGCMALCAFGLSLFAYLDDNDIHDDYIINDMLSESDDENLSHLLKMASISDVSNYNLSAGKIKVNRENIEEFEEDVKKLYTFLKVFKKELKDIHIDKREQGEYLSCTLELVYDNYSVDSEFESTGIKKLIKLFQYLQKMVEGNIVFIDEFDSNLHDVYLCALLEYLSEYAKGQLCFTSHNIGPMSVLKSKKKSIDFLSVDRTIYSWKTSGNYSPSTLYRNGMIEGSPFNVDLTDFIGTLD